MRKQLKSTRRERTTRGPVLIIRTCVVAKGERHRLRTSCGYPALRNVTATQSHIAAGHREEEAGRDATTKTMRFGRRKPNGDSSMQGYIDAPRKSHYRCQIRLLDDTQISHDFPVSQRSRENGDRGPARSQSESRPTSIPVPAKQRRENRLEAARPNLSKKGCKQGGERTSALEGKKCAMTSRSRFR